MELTSWVGATVETRWLAGGQYDKAPRRHLLQSSVKHYFFFLYTKYQRQAETRAAGWLFGFTTPPLKVQLWVETLAYTAWTILDGPAQCKRGFGVIEFKVPRLFKANTRQELQIVSLEHNRQSHVVQTFFHNYRHKWQIRHHYQINPWLGKVEPGLIFNAFNGCLFCTESKNDCWYLRCDQEFWM